MNLNTKIYVAGHSGLVGSALLRRLQAKGYTNIATPTHAKLDLTDQVATEVFLQRKSRNLSFLLLLRLVVFWLIIFIQLILFLLILLSRITLFKRHIDTVSSVYCSLARLVSIHVIVPNPLRKNISFPVCSSRQTAHMPSPR